MSSSCDEDYLQLCKTFEERSRRANFSFNTQNIDPLDDEELNSLVPNSFHYTWIVGKRSGSELMWAVEEQVLYVSNGKIIVKDQAEAFTCYIKNCSGRVYLKPDGIAYKVAEHSIQHGNMHNLYVELNCRNFMRDECKSAGASKSITDIYEEAVLL